jgi:capsule polysaccharide export protein KpsE/RkpR
LNGSQIEQTLQEIKTNFDKQKIEETLNDLKQFDAKVQSVNQSIKQISNRVNVELVPQIYAVQETNYQLVDHNIKKHHHSIKQMKLHLQECENHLHSLLQTQQSQIIQELKTSYSDQELSGLQHELGQAQQLLENNAPKLEALQQKRESLGKEA